MKCIFILLFILCNCDITIVGEFHGDRHATVMSLHGGQPAKRDRLHLDDDFNDLLKNNGL